MENNQSQVKLNGGQVMAIRQRQEAIKKYYENPNHCKFCLKIIKVNEKQKVAEVRKKKFCDRSCAAKLNNSESPKITAVDKGNCISCDQIINFTKRKGRNGYNKRKYCDSCLMNLKTKGKPMDSRTKDDLFSNRKNWQSASSAIRKHARRTYFESNRVKECIVCNYSNHIEISHFKAVSEFEGNALISEINALHNLIPLCPNHHWEFDNGMLSPQLIIEKMISFLKN